MKSAVIISAMAILVVGLAGCGGGGGAPSSDSTPVHITVQGHVLPKTIGASSAASSIGSAPSYTDSQRVLMPALTGTAANPWPIEVLPGSDGPYICGVATPRSGSVVSVTYTITSETGMAGVAKNGRAVVSVNDAGGSSWVLPSLPLTPGENTITISAIDSQDRTGRTSVHVTMPAMYIAVRADTGASLKTTRLIDIPLAWRENPIVQIYARVPAGRYQLGADAAATIGYDPAIDRQRPAIVDRYYLAMKPMNQMQWYALMGGTAPATAEQTMPITDVARDDIAVAAVLVSQRSGFTMRLPTDNEWEIAARASAPVGSAYYYPENAELANWVNAWDLNGHSEAMSTTGQLRTNGWGFNDMLGNQMEWTDTTMRNASFTDNWVFARTSAYVDMPGTNIIHPCVGVRLALTTE